jgi:hypothetical protein
MAFLVAGGIKGPLITLIAPNGDADYSDHDQRNLRPFLFQP